MRHLHGTHTFAELELTPIAYDEIRAKLTEAQYQHAFIDRATIDMHGIGVTRGEENTPIDIITACPKCHVVHIDEPQKHDAINGQCPHCKREVTNNVAEDFAPCPARWTNPPHREHECQNCGERWKPSNHPTNGVAVLLQGLHKYVESGAACCKCGEPRISVEHY